MYKVPAEAIDCSISAMDVLEAVYRSAELKIQNRQCSIKLVSIL